MSLIFEAIFALVIKLLFLALIELRVLKQLLQIDLIELRPFFLLPSKIFPSTNPIVHDNEMEEGEVKFY